MRHTEKVSTNPCGCVYVAFDSTKLGRCKIGYSSREAVFRIAEASNPDYKLFGQVKTVQAKAVERKCHEVLETAGIKRLNHSSGGRSEWFEFPAEDALRIVKCIVYAASSVPLKPLLPDLCRALVIEKIDEATFATRQWKVIVSSRRRRRVLGRVSQIVGGEVWGQFKLQVWLTPSSENARRNQLALLLRKYQREVPINKRSSRLQLEYLLPKDAISIPQVKSEEDEIRDERQKQSERVWSTIVFSNEILAANKNKELSNMISNLEVMMANLGPTSQSVQVLAEKLRAWIDDHYPENSSKVIPQELKNAVQPSAASSENSLSSDIQAVQRYRDAAQKGDAIAQFNLGVVYANGKGVPKDNAEAAKWYLRAAEQNLASAQLNLGVMYATGKGVAKDIAKAVVWYRRAAEQGQAYAQFNLAVLCAGGWGAPDDDPDAAKWYCRAADHEAVAWYRKAAEQGLVPAQFNLGVMLANGRGVPADASEASQWFRKAAEKGHATAQFNLAVMLSSSMEVPSGAIEAVTWYRKAAEQGYAASQFNLAVMLANGTGIARNDAEALQWYRKAAEQGHSGAKTNLDLMLNTAAEKNCD